MWTWIVNVLGLAGNVIPDTIRKWVSDLVTGIFGFIHTVFHLVGDGWLDVVHGASWLYTGIVNLAAETYLTLWHIVRALIPDVIRWADKFIHQVWAYAIVVFHWAAHEFDLIRHWVAALLDALRHWVITDIWTPIWRTLAPAWHWITHEGLALWNLVTHPALLVDWIWLHLLAKIEHEAWTAGRVLGRFFLSLVVHNIRTFAILIEDIVDAVL